MELVLFSGLLAALAAGAAWATRPGPLASAWLTSSKTRPRPRPRSGWTGSSVVVGTARLAYRRTVTPWRSRSGPGGASVPPTRGSRPRRAGRLRAVRAAPIRRGQRRAWRGGVAGAEGPARRVPALCRRQIDGPPGARFGERPALPAPLRFLRDPSPVAFESRTSSARLPGIGAGKLGGRGIG